MTHLVITPCGRTKAPLPARADRLYTGRYFTACLTYAHTNPDMIRIMSAKHGLIPLDHYTAPYDLKFGDPGAVTTHDIRRQATEQHLIDAHPVTILGGTAYTRPSLQVWPHATTPLIGLPGRMGGQIAALTAWTRAHQRAHTPGAAP